MYSTSALCCPRLSLLSMRRPPRPPLSLHDALPILAESGQGLQRLRGLDAVLAGDDDGGCLFCGRQQLGIGLRAGEDRKSTRLNSSHVAISYAVFCLKKRRKQARREITRVPTW